jgi:hypothetical protein
VIDNQTIQTYTLKRAFTANQLFDKACTKLSNPKSKPLTPPVELRAHQAKKPKPTNNQQPVNQSTKVNSVDWKAFCRQHGILPGVLKALAQELGLPMGKLNASQSATLYQHAYTRFVMEKASGQ